MGNLENKANGFFKRIINSTTRLGTIGMLSALALLAGCSQVQYRARVQTKPPEEVNIYIDGEEEGKTSKSGPVYVDSLSRPTSSQCRITLQANKYEAYFIMNYQKDFPPDLSLQDALKNKSEEKIKTLNPIGRSQHCLEARVTKWENGSSYDLLFEIPAELLADLHKPIKRYTEWGDEIKEPQKPQQTPAKEPALPYTAPKKEPYTKPEASKEPSEKPKPVIPIKPATPANVGKLVDKIEPVEFFAAIGAGNTFGGLGACGGLLLNLGEIPSIELSLGLGYMLAGYLTTRASSEFDTVAVEGNVALNLAYWKRFKGWSFYLKGFGGIQGKAIGKTDGRAVEEKLLFGMGLIGGHKWVFADKYFVLFGTGLRYTFMQEDFGDVYKTDLAIELGIGMKF